PRAIASKFAGRQRPGRAAFLYFATQLLRRHDLKKFEAMQASSLLINTFWNDDDAPYAELQLEGVHRRGKESLASNNLITAEEFVANRVRRQTASSRLVWVRLRLPRVGEGGG